MQLDIYRDHDFERLLIVKRGTALKDLKGLSQEFLNALARPNTVDSEFGDLPTCVKRHEVLEAIETRGYLAGTFKPTLRECDV
ncbi:hypothetical protein ACQJ0O_12790 [Pseudomonas shirazensis]|uniref:hypothetical protein n=1 Tax=Pseudomonas shirazensis TaxID=2745494 RepID=UPI003CFD43A1